MKKILLILLLLASTSYSADILDSFSGYRSQVKRNLNIADVDTLFMTDSSMNEMIRICAVAVVNEIRSVKEEFSFVTTYKQGTYSLDSLASGVIDVRWSKNDSVKTFLYAPKEQWYQLEFKKVDVKGYDKRSAYYDYNDDNIFIYPIPRQVGDTIKYQAWKKLPSISAIDTLSLVPQKYRPILEVYITSRIANAESNPLASYYRNEFLRLSSVLNIFKGNTVEAVE